LDIAALDSQKIEKKTKNGIGLTWEVGLTSAGEGG